jgi:hypothetical protein
MIVLLKNGRALAFPKAKIAEFEVTNANQIIRLVLKTRANGTLVADFNYDAIAGVIPNDSEYADMLAAEWSRNLGRQTDDSSSEG